MEGEKGKGENRRGREEVGEEKGERIEGKSGKRGRGKEKELKKEMNYLVQSSFIANTPGDMQHL